FSGPAAVVPFRPEVNGYVAIDVVNQAWPDHMGDPKSDVTLFAAWSMGQFGPFTFPGGLQRAQQQSWGWRDSAEAVSSHRGFIRLRTSYVFGADKDSPILPTPYDPIAELHFLDRLSLSLLPEPG